jgi:predicted ArsR family transcriptional regulator
MRIIIPPTNSNIWDKFFPKVCAEIEPGFQTLHEIAETHGVNRDKIARRMVKLLSDGLVEKKIFRNPKNNRPQNYYRPVSNENTQRNKKHRRHR